MRTRLKLLPHFPRKKLPASKVELGEKTADSCRWLILSTMVALISPCIMTIRVQGIELPGDSERFLSFSCADQHNSFSFFIGNNCNCNSLMAAAHSYDDLLSSTWQHVEFFTLKKYNARDTHSFFVLLSTATTKSSASLALSHKIGLPLTRDSLTQ